MSFPWATMGVPDEVQRYTNDILSVPEIRLVIYILSLLLSVVGAVGNGAVLYILTCGSEGKLTSSKLLVIILAVCDLATCVFILPTDMSDMLTGLKTHWARFVTEDYCKACTFISIYFACVKFHMVSVISVDRYILVCHPYKASTTLSVSKVTKIIIMVLIAAFAVSLPVPLNFTTTGAMKLNGTDVVFCSLLSEGDVDSTSWRIYFSVLFVLYYLTPLILISCMYTIIFRTLRRESSVTQMPSDAVAQQTAKRLSLARIMLAIAIIFALLNTPYFLFMLLITFGSSPPHSNGILLIMIVTYLAGLNSVINPFVYCGHTKSFFKRKLASLFGHSADKQGTDTRLWLSVFDTGVPFTDTD